MARIVTLKFYGGLTDKEVAETLQVTDRTVRNKWRFARAWLLEDIRNKPAMMTARFRFSAATTHESLTASNA